MKVQLVDNWRTAWRWFSQQCMAISIAIQGTWALMPADLRSSVPSEWITGSAILVLVLGMVGRMIKQKSPDDPDE